MYVAARMMKGYDDTDEWIKQIGGTLAAIKGEPFLGWGRILKSSRETRREGREEEGGWEGGRGLKGGLTVIVSESERKREREEQLKKECKQTGMSKSTGQLSC